MAEARDILGEVNKIDTQTTGDGTEILLRAMTLNPRAALTLKKALVDLPAAADHRNNEQAAKTVDALRTSIERLIGVLDRGFQVFQKVAAATDRAELAQTMAEAATVNALIGETWKLWLPSTVMLTYQEAQISQARDEDISGLLVNT